MIIDAQLNSFSAFFLIFLGINYRTKSSAILSLIQNALPISFSIL